MFPLKIKTGEVNFEQCKLGTMRENDEGLYGTGDLVTRVFYKGDVCMYG